jgi:hypothetical protein
MRVLVVKNPFGDFKRGDTITDEKDIERILSGDLAAHVVVSIHADKSATAEEE